MLVLDVTVDERLCVLFPIDRIDYDREVDYNEVYLLCPAHFNTDLLLRYLWPFWCTCTSRFSIRVWKLVLNILDLRGESALVNRAVLLRRGLILDLEYGLPQRLVATATTMGALVQMPDLTGKVMPQIMPVIHARSELLPELWSPTTQI